MDTVEAIHTRRSIRAYAARNVERQIIEDVVEDTAQAPTPLLSDAQPFDFIVVEGTERMPSTALRL